MANEEVAGCYNWRRRNEGEQKAIKISKHKQGSTIMAIKLCPQNGKVGALNTLT